MDQAAFHQITDQLAPLGVVESKMFGMAIWKLNGKALGGPREGDMVFKLDSPALEAALALPRATHFDPSGHRPMKQWVRLGPEHAAKWLHYAEQAAQAAVH
jgi:hypothetical protein